MKAKKEFFVILNTLTYEQFEKKFPDWAYIIDSRTTCIPLNPNKLDELDKCKNQIHDFLAQDLKLERKEVKEIKTRNEEICYGKRPNLIYSALRTSLESIFFHQSQRTFKKEFPKKSTEKERSPWILVDYFMAFEYWFIFICFFTLYLFSTYILILIFA